MGDGNDMIIVISKTDYHHIESIYCCRCTIKEFKNIPDVIHEYTDYNFTPVQHVYIFDMFRWWPDRPKVGVRFRDSIYKIMTAFTPIKL